MGIFPYPKMAMCLHAHKIDTCMVQHYISRHGHVIEYSYVYSLCDAQCSVHVNCIHIYTYIHMKLYYVCCIMHMIIPYTLIIEILAHAALWDCRGVWQVEFTG